MGKRLNQLNSLLSLRAFYKHVWLNLHEQFQHISALVKLPPVMRLSVRELLGHVDATANDDKPFHEIGVAIADNQPNRPATSQIKSAFTVQNPGEVGCLRFGKNEFPQSGTASVLASVVAADIRPRVALKPAQFSERAIRLFGRLATSTFTFARWNFVLVRNIAAVRNSYRSHVMAGTEFGWVVLARRIVRNDFTTPASTLKIGQLAAPLQPYCNIKEY